MLRAHRRAHAWIWSLAAVSMPLILIGGLVLKYTRPAPPANVRLAAPPAAAIRDLSVPTQAPAPAAAESKP